MSNTQPLPGGRREPFPVWRLAMGFVDEQGRPQQSDYFRVTRKAKVGQRWTWVQDKEAQKWMCEAAASDKPTRIPVIFPFHGYAQDGEWVPASDHIYRAMSLYTASYRVCACERYVPKPEEVCRQQELPWPPRSTDVHDRPMDRDYYWSPGEDAVRLYYRKDSEGNNEVVRRENLRCDPMVCEFANAATAQGLTKLLGNAPQSMVGITVCKPQVVCPLILPWIQQGSPLGKLSSSGRNTAFVLPASLDDIEQMAGRAPVCLLHDGKGGPGLLLAMKRPDIQTPKGRFQLPVAEFESAAPYLQLGLIGREVVNTLAESEQNRRLLDQYSSKGTAIVRQELESAEDTEAFTTEFRPEVVAADFGIETPYDKYEKLAEELGWSPAQTGGVWDTLLVNGEIDGAALDEQVGKMEEQLLKHGAQKKGTEQRLFEEES